MTTTPETERWDRLASASPLGHINQCWWWAAPLTSDRVRADVLAIHDRHALIGGALVRSIKIPGTKWSLSTCSGGPIVGEAVASSRWAGPFVYAVQQLAHDVNSIAVRFEGVPAAHHGAVADALYAAQLPTRAEPAGYEAVLPLVGTDLATIWKGFSKGTRYRVRKGLKSGIAVRRLETPDEFDGAHATWQATAARKGFSDLRPRRTMEPMVRYCLDHNLGFLLGSFHGDRLVASLFVTLVGGRPFQLYSGYAEGAERLNATHVLRSEAMRICLKRGFAEYNMGNLLSWDLSKPDGVDRFKLGFGTQPRRKVSTLTWVRRPVIYNVAAQVRGQLEDRTDEILRRFALRTSSHPQSTWD